MDNTEPLQKKKGNKTKHVTPEEVGAIKALLKLKLYTAEEIGAMVGRSDATVGTIAAKYKIPLLGQSKRSEEYKMRLAQMFGDVSEKMLESVSRIKPEELDKMSLGQRAMTAGIFADKLAVLSKTKEEEMAEKNITLSWVQLVQQTTPGRTKDGTDALPAPKETGNHDRGESIEDVTPIVEGDRSFLE